MHEIINIYLILVVMVVLVVMGFRYFFVDTKNHVLRVGLVGLVALLIWAISNVFLGAGFLTSTQSEVFHYWVNHIYVVIAGVALVCIMHCESKRN